MSNNNPDDNIDNVNKSKSIKEDSKTGFKKIFSCDDNPSDIKMIVLGLFALIAFIILIYSIFVAAVGEPLAAVIDTVFIAALIGSFTLVGTIISNLYIKK
ncbi:MAG: hypothetical protein ACPKPY_00225 [Nitrososphaeraceae archaeon]